jgi:hypothetical protein
MMRLTRLGLATAFVVALAGAPVARAAEPDKLLPADADTVAYINVKQLLESDVVKKYALEQIKQTLAGQDVKKLLEDMGLDPLKDIETIWTGLTIKGADDTKGLVVAHGKFDREKLLKAAEAAAKKDGDKFSMVKDGNNTLFKFQPDQGNPLYATVVDDTTVVAGTDKKLIATALTQQKVALSKELATLVKNTDAKASVFAVSVVKDKFNNVQLPAQLPIDLSGFQKALPNTDTLSVVIKVTGDIKLEVTFGMKDDDAATDMGDAMAKLIDGIKGLVPLLAAADPKAKPLVDVVKTIKSDVKKKDVTIVGTVTGDNIGKMINPDN